MRAAPPVRPKKHKEETDVDSWVLDLFVLLNAVMFLIAFGCCWTRSRKDRREGR